MTDVQRLYDQKYQHDRGQFQTFAIWHRQILRILADQPRSQRVLDLGCGNGRLLKAIVDLGFTAEGVDVSPEAVALCQAQGLQAQTVDITQDIPFRDQFDICVSAEVIEHVFDPYHFLGQINRLLKPGGLAIITTPNFGYYAWTWRYLRGQSPTQIQNPYHIRFFTASYLTRVAQVQGFDVLSLYGGVVRLIPLASLFDRLRLTRLWTRFSARWGKSLIVQLQKTGTPRFADISEVYATWRA